LTCTTNHSGNWNAGTPVGAFLSSSSTIGGPFSGTGFARFSTAATFVESLSSTIVGISAWGNQ
jgi:hypothetical protein